MPPPLVRGGVPPPCQPLRGSNSTPLWEGKPSPRFAAPPTRRLAARSARKEGRPGLCQWRKVARHRRPQVDAKKERALERIGEPLAGFSAFTLTNPFGGHEKRAGGLPVAFGEGFPSTTKENAPGREPWGVLLVATSRRRVRGSIEKTGNKAR